MYKASRASLLTLHRMLFAVLIVLLSAIVAYFYVFCRRAYGYWKSLGVPYEEPECLFFGSSFNLVFARETATDVYQKIYNSHSREKFCGFYHMTRPHLLIRSPELVEAITVKDFSYFQNRHMKANTELDELSAHLVNLRDEQWRVTRHKMNPTFSSSKLKHMHGQLTDCADNLVERLASVEKSTEVNIGDFIRRYGMDALCSCAFGIDAEAPNNPSATILGVVRRIFEPSRLMAFKRFLRTELDWFFTLLRWRNVPVELEKYFKNLIDEILEHREKQDAGRVDFLQLTNDLVKNDLLLIRDGQLDKDDPNVFTKKLMYANEFVFFLAGLETTTSTICYTLYELALNTGIQEEAYQEIKRIVTKHGHLAHEAIKEMTYLSHVLSESLRKYPPVPLISREASKNYKIPETDITLPKGMVVFIPVHSIQHDPKYFPDPYEFKPERFTHQILPGSYLPFGDGPRKCIGARFAELEAKIALSKILLEYTVTRCHKTEVPLTMDKRVALLATPKGGIWLGLERRTKNQREDSS